MDHGHMGHSMPGMDHGGHAGHDMPGMEETCKMNMLFNWDTTDLCIVFPSWHVRGFSSFVVSLLAVMVLTAGYEAIREVSRQYETRIAIVKEFDAGTISADIEANETSSLLPSGRRSGINPLYTGRPSRVVKAALYGFQVFYSFFIMLLFMTYNGYIMVAVGIGAFFGYLIFGNKDLSSSKTVACH